ncbi:MAG: hypothetical protein FWF25_07955 [Propionibacteriaceae bacterium]|nr:hypothetical protein [Propionibacteriaceae bacterium]
MKKLIAALAGIVLVAGLTGCSHNSGPNPTEPPEIPTHQIAGSVLPQKVAGYTALGPTPAPDQTSVTYASDAQPLDLAVVSFDPTGQYGQVTLTGQQWYGASRCGTLWKGDAKATPQQSQIACVTVLTDGVMTTVSGGQQTASDMAVLANAIYDQLS